MSEERPYLFEINLYIRFRRTSWFIYDVVIFVIANPYSREVMHLNCLKWMVFGVTFKRMIKMIFINITFQSQNMRVYRLQLLFYIPLCARLRQFKSQEYFVYHVVKHLSDIPQFKSQICNRFIRLPRTSCYMMILMVIDYPVAHAVLVTIKIEKYYPADSREYQHE